MDNLVSRYWRAALIVVGLTFGVALGQTLPENPTHDDLEGKLAKLQGLDRVPMLIQLSQLTVKSTPDLALQHADEAC